MILNFKRISILSLAVALAAACEPEALAPDSSVPQQVVLGQDVVRGELLIRFDERVVGILDEAGLTRSGSKAPLSECPIPSVEEVLSMVEGYTIERVFPVDPRSEELARKEGLHLWYRVRFAEDAPMEQMIAKLSRLGEVSTVNCNRRLRKNWSEKVIPFDPASRTTALGSSPSAAPTRATTPRFNDGGLQYQWHLVNKGDLGATKFTAGADVNVLPAWDLCTGDPSIIVAVLDEGIAYDHPDLKDAMWINEDEVWRSRTDNDGNGYPGDVYGYNFALDTPIITVN
ncbi:MAG: subtilase family N-terminal domain-containing protein, partial [Bacteroidales bacterium]|nr:subtilase family N-terminal domain-containing protein [Bacteroidales bacterium]